MSDDNDQTTRMRASVDYAEFVEALRMLEAAKRPFVQWQLDQVAVANEAIERMRSDIDYCLSRFLNAHGAGMTLDEMDDYLKRYGGTDGQTH